MFTNLYANAVASYMSGRLLGIDKMRRIAAADSFETAVKMLTDYGYGGGITGADGSNADRFITAEIRALCAFVEETSSSGLLTRCILSRFYYADAKVLYKSRYATDGETTVLRETLYLDDKAMAEAFSTHAYDGLPVPMRDAVTALDDLSTQKKASAKQIDQAFTRAMFLDNLNCVRKSRVKCLEAYCRAQIDIANILSAYRAGLLKMTTTQLNDELYEGGAVPLECVREVLNGNYGGFEGTPYENAVHKLRRGKTEAYLKQSDELLLETLKPEFEKTSGYGALLRYFLEKILEFKAVKYILVCVKNKIKVDFDARVWTVDI